MTDSTWIANQFLKEATKDMNIKSHSSSSRTWQDGGSRIQIIFGSRSNRHVHMLFRVESSNVSHSTRNVRTCFHFADPNIVSNMKEYINDYVGQFD